jgi:dynein light intermediate chain 2
VTDVNAVPEDPARDPTFREPQIDQLRGQKDEDLERYRKDIEKRFRQINDEFDQSMILHQL